ncbi:26S proteasome non-ATPase regulatory subunit 6 [Phytophthora palmivora]|uniref:26S proteasome non-ATPase regulatory subunit 6 n=1 Tax=Phytophthora palmivora TaxID=4796 RepID=A0A2P4YQJ7_9STRA|nr:26S proteasome non-ATPase regulatory subunit 6 [Phytophthora palmivora]
MAADDVQPPKTLKKQASVGNISEEIEDDLSTLPNMTLSQLHFLLQHQHAANSTLSPEAAAAAKTQVQELIQQNDMAPFYRIVCDEFQWPVDAALETQMSQKNEQELTQLDERLADAEQNLGDIEVLEALLAKARMYSRIGDKEKALEAFKVAGEKPQSINQKILVALHIIRIGLFFSDLELVETYIKKATSYVRKVFILL